MKTVLLILDKHFLKTPSVVR